MLGDKIGIFPISYVEFNSAALQLIELDKPPEGGVEMGEGPSGCGKGGEGKKNTRKRHSFTSLTIGKLQTHLRAALPQVHICTTGLIVTPPPSSPVTTATVFTFPPETTYVSIPADGLPPPPPPPPQSSAVGAASLAAGQRPSLSNNDAAGRQRPTVYVAMFPYMPRKEDELELRKGEMFLVLERCQDGWSGCLTQTGRGGVTILAPSSPLGASVGGADPSKPLPSGLGSSPACPLPTAVVAAAHLQAPPTKVLMHMTGQMTVNQARNAVRTGKLTCATPVSLTVPIISPASHSDSSGRLTCVLVFSASCHSQERPTAAVTPIQAQTAAAYLPHLPAGAQPAFTLTPGPTRTGVALTCAAASLTPPNVNAASLTPSSTGSAPIESDSTPRPMAVMAAPVAPGNVSTAPVATSNATATPALTCRLDKDGKKEKKGLLKLLSGTSAKKKSRPSPPPSPTLESEQVEGEGLQGAMGPELPGPAQVTVTTGNQDSSPSPSSSAPPCAESSLRKSSSLDPSPPTAPIAPPPRQPCSSLHSQQQDARPIVCERYRVVVSYPPQSEAELELKEGDIVFVHKKRDDGCFHSDGFHRIQIGSAQKTASFKLRQSNHVVRSAEHKPHVLRPGAFWGSGSSHQELKDAVDAPLSFHCSVLVPVAPMGI
ncbi:hypothetical protein JZ751_018460, partial [Albula glossodonta]